MTWSGDVDGTIEVTFRKREAKVHVVTGKKVEHDHALFATEFPKAFVRLILVRKEGRGQVTVFQQAGKSNKYTAGFRITDNAFGRGHYRVVFSWR
jgi:hypothetical protein